MVTLQSMVTVIDFLALIGQGAVFVMLATIDCRVTINVKDTIVLCNRPRCQFYLGGFFFFTSFKKRFKKSETKTKVMNPILFYNCNPSVTN